MLIRASPWLLVGHLAALAFGLVGMLVMIPNPWLWAGSPWLTSVFVVSMEHAGALHIALGAAAMFAFGLRRVGVRMTLVFFAASTLLSLCFELLGTGTGWPFGAYEYTQGLGFKIGGRVPYTIPLSWFYVGFAAYLLADGILVRHGIRRRGLASVLLGSWLLMVWDLALDPAMAHEALPIRFWVWHQVGPYFGMPLQNLAGWYGTGLLFMALSRWLWRRDVPSGEPAIGYPLIVYSANLVFAMALSASVGLWLPTVAALGLGLVPTVLALRPSAGWRAPVAHRSTAS